MQINTKEKNIENFLKHNGINDLVEETIWTISNSKKIPQNIVDLILLDKESNAYNHTEEYLTSARLLVDCLADKNLEPNNLACFLDTIITNYAVIDIEPKCPDVIKEKFLNLKDDCIKYKEVSLSGKGIHLFIEITNETFEKYPILLEKTVIKEKHGWYELLLSHYVTFTMKEIESYSDIEKYDEEYIDVYSSIDDILEYLTSTTKITNSESIDIEILTDENVENLPGYNRLYSLGLDKIKEYTKTPEDFSNDMSRYEFGIASYLMYNLKNMTNISYVKIKHEYTNDEIIYIGYKILTETLTPRKKHKQKREKLPWLYYLVKRVVETSK